jgi:hypothetical protein
MMTTSRQQCVTILPRTTEVSRARTDGKSQTTNARIKAVRWIAQILTRKDWGGFFFLARLRDMWFKWFGEHLDRPLQLNVGHFCSMYVHIGSIVKSTVPPPTDGAVTMCNWYELKLTVRGSRNGQDLSVNYGDVLGSL